MDKETKQEFGKVKEEFTKVRKEIKGIKEQAKGFVTKEHFNSAIKLLVTRVEFEEFRDYVMENMLTRREFLDYMSRFEDILMEMRDMRQNRLLFEKQFVDIDDKVANHETRIKVLEHSK